MGLYIKCFGKVEEDCVNLCFVVLCRHPVMAVSISETRKTVLTEIHVESGGQFHVYDMLK